MLRYNYTNIIVGMVIAIAIPTILFLLFPYHNKAMSLIISSICPLFVYFRYANSIEIGEKELVVKQSIKRRKTIKFDDIRHITVLKESFFISETIKLVIDKEKGRICVHLGSLPATQINTVVKLLGSGVRVLC